MKNQTIITYNINGLRAAIKKGFYDWLSENEFDIVCLQETKSQLEQVDVEPLEKLGYHHYWHSAEKKGYSGVATFTKQIPDLVKAGCGIREFDDEGRILRTDFEELTLLNCYFPSGSSGDHRQEIKMRFLATFEKWIEQLRIERNQIIVVGDLNIAHTEIDIHNPKSNKNSSGFLPEERDWFSKWLNRGWVDSYRYLNPDTQKYSWWNLRSRARERNKGWRIDYECVTENLKENLIAADLLNDIHHSDHCPVLLKIRI